MESDVQSCAAMMTLTLPQRQLEYRANYLGGGDWSIETRTPGDAPWRNMPNDLLLLILDCRLRLLKIQPQELTWHDPLNDVFFCASRKGKLWSIWSHEGSEARRFECDYQQFSDSFGLKCPFSATAAAA